MAYDWTFGQAGKTVPMMQLSLAGRTAFVSGSTAGIGLASAAALAALGARVVVNARTQARVDDAIRFVRERVAGAQVDGVAADLSTAAGADAVVRALPDVDVLVNNLGIFEPRPFEQIDDRDWGRIVFVSSESGLHIPAEMVHYGVTKTAQIALARGIAEGLAGTGVTVNSVLPGPTKSEGVGTFVKQMAEQQHVSESEMERRFFDTARPTSLLRRFITSDEVANLIAYVCSPAASATTGSALRVDGGVVRAIP